MGSPIPAMGSPIPATCSPSSAKWWTEGGIPHLCSARWGGTPRTPGGGRDGTRGHRGGGTGRAGARRGWAGRTSPSHPFRGDHHDPYTERLEEREEAAVKVLAAM